MSDIEEGADSGEWSLYPLNMMNENPELRWSFIRKVYSIVIFQLLIFIAVVSVVIFFPPIANFFNNYIPIPYYGILILALFAQCSAEYYQETKHLLSYFFLLISNVSFALIIGLFCALCGGKIIEVVDAVIVITIAVIFNSIVMLTTIVVVLSLTLYTFWATKRGHDFNFLYKLSLGSFLVMILFVPCQIWFFPFGKWSAIIFGCLGCITYCSNIIYDTDSLIKRIPYAKYISVSISLYLNVAKPLKKLRHSLDSFC